MNQATETPPRITLEVSPDDAGLILDGLRMLLNCKRYATKDLADDPREIHAQYYDVVERIGQQIDQALGKAPARP